MRDILLKLKRPKIIIYLALLAWFLALAVYANAETAVKMKSKDTNADGKPDQYTTNLKGRQLILKEYDRNFDGKIDKRKISEWGERRLIPGQPAVPSYVTLVREEDKDFDGKIDVYWEKGNKATKDKIGQPFDTNPGGGDLVTAKKPEPSAVKSKLTE